MIFHRLLAIFLLCCSRLIAQQLAPESFVQYTKEEGLSHNYVTGLAQDSTGYLWISTVSGLNRFNGSQFVQFHSSNDKTSLPAEDLVGGLIFLDKNRLAASTDGLHIIHTKTGEKRNLFVPYHRQQYQYKFNMLMRPVGDADGSIYVLSRSGFYHFDKDYNLLFRFDYYSEKEVLTEHFFFGEQLLELDKERLLIVARDHLYLYEKNKKRFKVLEAGDCPPMAEFVDRPVSMFLFLQQEPGRLLALKAGSDSLVSVNIPHNKKTVSHLPFSRIESEFGWRTRLFRESDSVFYITGHFSGFFKLRFYPETGAVKFYPEKQFPHFLCTALLQDRDGLLWVGTDKGLFRQDRGRLQVQVAGVPPAVTEAFPNLVMSEVFVTADKIYAGTRNSFGNLLVYDKGSMRFLRNLSLEQHRKNNGWTFDIFSIEEAGPNTLLLATDGPLVLVDKNGTKSRLLFPPKWAADDWSGDLFQDSRGTLWVSSLNVYRYNRDGFAFAPVPEPLLRSSKIVQPEIIREDGAGNIWMAGHGLSRYNTALQQFDLRLDSFPFINMPDKQISTLVIDKGRNTIWFNSRNNGLMAYAIDKGSFRHFTTADGLPENNIASLTLGDNKLWIACSSMGIACLDLQTFEITVFGRQDGFPDVSAVRRGNFFYDSLAHQLYLGSGKSLIRFDPAQVLREKAPPQVFIEDFAISGQPPVFLPAGTVSTTWKKNQVRITIGTINFSDGYSQRFAYRLVKDSSTPWTELERQSSFSISGLLPGTHRIQVKVYSPTNRWHEQVQELLLVVSPPFWLQDWFVLVTAALVGLAIYLLVRWRTGLARKKEMEKTHLQWLKAEHYKSQFELEQITSYFSSSLAGKKTEEEVLWDVAQNLIGRLNYEDCVIYLWNRDQTKMVQKAAYGPKGTPENLKENVFEVEPGQGIVGYVMQSRQPLLVHDTRTDSRYRVDDAFRLSEVTVPIIHNDQLLGIIDAEHSKAYYFSERDIKILTTIATLLANKLRQLESEQSLEAKQQELAGINEQLAEARLSALQAQMNPHFVFNALNSIKRMILDEDNEKASRYLSKFALMIRMTLDHSKTPFVSLGEQVEYLKAYLEMERLRFDDSFTYTLFADERLDAADTMLPSMMIQPLVENAIWHGLLPAEGEKKISIRFIQSGSGLVCTVEDNGIGIQQSEKLRETQRPLHRSVGLQNLHNRIRIMNEKYHTSCSLEIFDRNGEGRDQRGTRAVLQFDMTNDA